MQKLQKFVKPFIIEDDELLNLLDVIEKNCEIFVKYKKSSLKPAVRFFLSKEINDIFLIDLKYINGITFLDIIDNATKFSAAAVVKSKHQEEIVDIKKYAITSNILKLWDSFFSKMLKIKIASGITN